MIGEAATVARALKARPSGNDWMASCPCPGHGRGRGDRNPSLSISEGDDGALLLNCFAGCTWEDLKPELEKRGAITVGGSRLVQARNALTHAARAPERAEADPEALRVWRESIPLFGTPVQNYLKRRGLAEHPASLRCCYQFDDDVGMIAAVQRSDGEIINAQVKLVTKDGRKVRPDTLGKNLGDGAVRLSPAADVMGLAEGVETGLSAMLMARMPVWVSLGSKRLHKVVVPDSVRELHIFRDNDEPGREAAQRTADVHLKAGRDVVLQSPPDRFKDFNDWLVDRANSDGGVAA